jgi:hypothetical protein
LTAIEFVKGLIPAPARQLLHTQYDDYIFNSAVKKFSRDPRRWMYSHSPVLRDLIRGWNNEGYSANDEFLVASLRNALEKKGPILECGSGLTTILLGLVADSLGCEVWSLEHSPEWAGRVRKKLDKYRIRSVRLCVCPLKPFSGFSWYGVPLQPMPDFSLVVCDGPPADTPGGRYGLLPIMKDKLKANAVILLDDAGRRDERVIATRWAAELQTNFQILGTEKPYALLSIPAK